MRILKYLVHTKRENICKEKYLNKNILYIIQTKHKQHFLQSVLLNFLKVPPATIHTMTF